MRHRLILNVIFLLFFWQCGLKSDPEDNDVQNLVIEGEGVGQFRVGKTRLDDIIDTLGLNYDEIKHENLRLEANYKEKGLSFYYQSNDSSKTIYVIILREPFSGKTGEGIGLESTMEEVSKAYGSPKWLTPCEDCDTWTVTYKGIEFEIERDKSLPKFPFDEGVHLKKRISKIVVYKNYL